MIEKLKPNYTFTEDKLEQLKEVLPEAFADGKINFESIKEILGDYLEEENQEREHFGLFWVGKRQARKVASIPSKGTLVPVKGEGIDEDNTKNIFIEGDNLEVLKLLQKSYANRIKMIYIDPPYNTGNDFVYEDDFSEPMKEYLRRTGQVDEQGRELTTNKKSDGRYHAKWLSMMYPRLTLARNLLRDDGVIFISIDDNEVANLKLLCNEIFGEENFVVEMVWKKRTGSNDSQNFSSTDHEYILSYGKTLDVQFEGLKKTFENYKNPDNDPRGVWIKDNLTCNKTSSERPNLFYDIIDPNTGIQYKCNPNRVWVYEKNRMQEMISQGKVLFPKDGKGTPVYKRHMSEVRSDKQPFSSILDVQINSMATKQLRDLFGFQVFDYPKGIDLIKKLLEQGTKEQDIILDFFSGSGTTAHAVLDINKEDGGNRQFICVQIPEKTKEDSEAFKSGYKYISEITKERIRRAINKIKSENEGKLDFNENNQDLGFKVFKLQESNYKEWKDFEGNDTQQLELSFDTFLSPLRENWKKEDLISEIILIEGFSLDSKLQLLEQFTKNQVVEVVSEFCSHKLLICLDQKLEEDTINSLVLNENDIFICLDTAIDDNYKIKLSDKGLIKTV